MNVYSCWYRGNLGYGCRLRDRNWMFVPDLGQADGAVKRDLTLDDLVFRNPRERSAELERERELRRFRGRRWIGSLWARRSRPVTVGGMLLLAA